MTMELEAARQAARAAHQASKAKLVRKVWVLPADLSLRIVQYQAARALPSEVAAARELLESGLLSWEAATRTRKAAP